MKKTITLSLSVLAVSISQAAYMVKVNLDDEVTFYQWSAEQPILGPWVNTGSVYDCSNWTPNPSTITVNMPFTQTATDCKQNQEQTAQDREIDSVSGTVRNSGDPYVNTQYITVGNTRPAVGLLETWTSISPDYTAWVNNGAINSCSNWSPATNTVLSGQSFTQTATDCKQPQTRTRQERERETTTLAIRNNGLAVTETQSINATSTRSAIGTKSATDCRFNDVTDNVTSYGSIATYMFTWGGEYFWMGDGGPVLNYNGYRYTISNFVKTEYTTMLQVHYYTICRTPL